MISGPGRNLSRLFLTPWIYHCLRLFIGGLFLYTGATKLADTAGFGQAIAAYGILPAILVPCALLEQRRLVLVDVLYKSQPVIQIIHI